MLRGRHESTEESPNDEFYSAVSLYLSCFSKTFDCNYCYLETNVLTFIRHTVSLKKKARGAFIRRKLDINGNLKLAKVEMLWRNRVIRNARLAPSYSAIPAINIQQRWMYAPR